MKPYSTGPRNAAEWRRMSDMQDPKVAAAIQAFNEDIKKLKKNSSELTSLSLSKHDEKKLINDYSNLLDLIAKTTHLQTLELPIYELDILKKVFELSLVATLPLKALTLTVKNPIKTSSDLFQSLFKTECKLTHLTLKTTDTIFDDFFVEDFFSALKKNTTIQELSMPMNIPQQKMLIAVLQEHNFSLQKVNTQLALLPELKKLLERNQLLSKEVLDNCNNNSLLSSKIQQFKIQRDPEVVHLFQNVFSELRIEFLRNNLFFDFWQTCKTQYLNDIDLSLLLAQTFHGEKIVANEGLNQLIVFYFVLHTKHLIYQEALFKALQNNTHVPIANTLKQYANILESCESLVRMMSLNSLGILDGNKVLLQKTKTLMTKYSNLFPEFQSFEVLEEKLATSDYQGFLSNLPSTTNTTNNNAQAINYCFESNLSNAITSSMYQQELLHVLTDNTLFLTENYIHYLSQIFDKPIEKLQMLDEVAEMIADQIDPYIHPQQNQSSWRSWLPLWKSKEEKRDLRDPREKIEQLKAFYQNICKQNNHDPEVKAQAEKSPLLKIQTSVKATEDEGQEMKAIHHRPFDPTK